MNAEKLTLVVKDLAREFPRSPREMLGGYVILPRCLDKCRSFLMGINGDYNYWPCSLCAQLEEFTGIDHEDFKDYVQTGASDEEVGEWVNKNSQAKSKMEVIKWNNKMRDMRLSEMTDQAQEFMESYIPENVPQHRPVYVWFDVFDLEEDRL